MTFPVKKLNSQSLPYDSNKLQLPVKSQKVKKKNKSCFTVLPPAHGQERGREREVKKGGDIL